jgi:hypothetical protein
LEIIISAEFEIASNLWVEVEKRRKFFENYAKRKGFDPLIPENWYVQSRKKITSTEVLSPPPLHSRPTPTLLLSTPALRLLSSSLLSTLLHPSALLRPPPYAHHFYLLLFSLECPYL